MTCLEFNPFQPQLLACGSSDGEVFFFLFCFLFTAHSALTATSHANHVHAIKVYVWNIDNPASPTVFPPAPKNPHTAGITCLAWNRKYQQILATASSNGMVVIWDLKKKKTVSTFNVKHPVTSLCWNPEEVFFFFVLSGLLRFLLPVPHAVWCLL